MGIIRWLCICMSLGTSYTPLLAQANLAKPPKMLGTLRIREKPYIPDVSPQELFIHEVWYPGRLLTRSGIEVKDHLMRYNLTYDQLEIMVAGQVRLVDLSRIKRFSWVIKGSTVENYLNTQYYMLDGMSANGVAKVWYQGTDIILVERWEIKTQEANYIPQLDAGIRQRTYLRLQKFCWLNERKMIEIPRGWKNALVSFGPHRHAIRKFVQDQTLSFREPHDLIRIATYYDSLLD